MVLADDDGAIAAFHVDERLQPGARAAVDALARDGLTWRSQAATRSKGRAVAATLGIETLGRAPDTRGQARVARVAARDRRARRRRWRRRERCPDARRCRRRRGGELGRRRGAGGERHRDHRQLGALAEARTLAQQMLAILRQNRRWALGYNLATVPLAALGFVPPWLAAIGMSASSLAVVLNALRIGRASAVRRKSRTRDRRTRGDPSPARVGMTSLAVPDSAVDPAPRRRRSRLVLGNRPRSIRRHGHAGPAATRRHRPEAGRSRAR